MTGLPAMGLQFHTSNPLLYTLQCINQQVYRFPFNSFNHFKSTNMMYYLKVGSLLMISLIVVSAAMASSKSIGQQERVLYPNELDMVDDDGSLDNALLNYLFARQMVNRIRNNMDVTDLQRKRSYWKQCAFNAVSCFGKK